MDRRPTLGYAPARPRLTVPSGSGSRTSKRSRTARRARSRASLSPNSKKAALAPSIAESISKAICSGVGVRSDFALLLRLADQVHDHREPHGGTPGSALSLPMIVVHSLGLACGVVTLAVATRFREPAP
jgi:hypothetical protein